MNETEKAAENCDVRDDSEDGGDETDWKEAHEPEVENKQVAPEEATERETKDKTDKPEENIEDDDPFGTTEDDMFFKPESPVITEERAESVVESSESSDESETEKVETNKELEKAEGLIYVDVKSCITIDLSSATELAQIICSFNFQRLLTNCSY